MTVRGDMLTGVAPTVQWTCTCGKTWKRSQGLWLKCHCGANHRPLSGAAFADKEGHSA